MPPPPKKGMPVWGWILIGLGGLMVLGMIAVGAAGYFLFNKAQEVADNPAIAMAKIAAAADPNVEVLDTDEGAGTITIRNRKTGETVTVNADKIREGKIEFTTPEGRATFGAGSDVKFPKWVPIPSGAKTIGGMSADSSEGAGGTVVIETSLGIDEVKAFYEDKVPATGIDLNSNMTTTVNGVKSVTLAGESQGGGRTLAVTIFQEGGSTKVNLVFGEKLKNVQ